MEKKEQMFRMFSLLSNFVKHLEEKEHHFDANADECKTCNAFIICQEFTGMMKAVADSDYDKDVKIDLASFLIFMKKEYLFVNDFDIDDILKDDESLLSGYYRRFESVIKEFKHYDELVAILNDEQLGVLRKIVLDVTAKIEELMNKIMNRNRFECNVFIRKLQKPQQEEKSYEDMTREELIEELKNKHS